jgi:regulation of enolase protein 1 (concanavalin A-like superfamily)
MSTWTVTTVELVTREFWVEAETEKEAIKIGGEMDPEYAITRKSHKHVEAKEGNEL